MKQLEENPRDIFLLLEWMRSNIRSGRYVQVGAEYIASQLGGEAAKWTEELNQLVAMGIVKKREDRYTLDRRQLEITIQIRGENGVVSLTPYESDWWRGTEEAAIVADRFDYIKRGGTFDVFEPRIASIASDRCDDDSIAHASLKA